MRVSTNFALFLSHIRSNHEVAPNNRDIARYANVTESYVSARLLRSNITQTTKELDANTRPPGVVKTDMAWQIYNGIREDFPYIDFKIHEIWRGPDNG